MSVMLRVKKLMPKLGTSSNVVAFYILHTKNKIFYINIKVIFFTQDYFESTYKPSMRFKWVIYFLLSIGLYMYNVTYNYNTF